MRDSQPASVWLPFLPGLDVLLGRHARWLKGARVGLVSHQAAVDRAGGGAAERLRRDGRFRLACLMGPEHGFFGAAGAGETCGHARHPDWGLPVYSLYGDTRRPTADMLRRVDVVVFDIQDLGVRAYTYCSTLRFVLEAAAACGKPVIVADRPVPLPRVTDGPVTDPAFASFVAQIPAPLAYGMTPGETALWLRAELALDLDLRVAPMRGYRRQAGRGADWPPWVPPSPAMASWETAMCYPATVAFEALGAVDYGRGTRLPFQVLGAPWMRGEKTAVALERRRLPGVRFYAHRYESRAAGAAPVTLDGVRMAVVDPGRFRPALTSAAIVRQLQRLYGVERVWEEGRSRPEFFDKLWGTDAVRRGLLRGDDEYAIAARWRAGLARFRKGRAMCLLYPGGG